MLITRNSILAGLDLGKRRDHSALVLVVREPKRIRVTHATRLPREISYQEQLQAIAAPLAEADLVGLDRSGVGDGVIEMMPRFFPAHPPAKRRTGGGP